MKEYIDKLSSKKWLIPSTIALLVCVFVFGIAVWKLNKYTLVLSVSDKIIEIEYGEEKLPEITALCRGTLLHRKGKSVDTKMSGNVNLTKLGVYKVTFSATYHNMTISEDRTIAVVDTTAPEIKLVSSPDYYTNPSAAYVEEGFTATDNYDGDLTEKVISTEQDGKILYTVSDSSGNTATAERTILYKDIIAPTITLTEGTSIARNRGADFTDPGYSAVDECDGDLTGKVTVEGKVDGHTYGTYTLTYRVSDSSGNKSELQRTVRIADLIAPTIALNGATMSYIKVGTAYADPGFSASDNMDGDMTAKVAISGGVDTSKMGINTITYTATDTFGNTTTVNRTIYVYEKQAVANPINPGNKVVYLTFDDGPSKYTARLLNILDQYGVKATFFVTNQFPQYQSMIGETYRRGHTIALHTATHKYNQLYASEAAYYQDLDSIKNIVVA